MRDNTRISINTLGPSFSSNRSAMALKILAAASVAYFTASAWARNPVATAAATNVQLQNIVKGNVEVSQKGNVTQIDASNGAIINYKSFDIPAGSTVDIVLPSATSKVFDRITSGVQTQINGNLISNGNVYVLNPAGISFGSGATVNTAGMYAVAGSLSDASIAAGKNQFTQLAGTVANQGDIHSSGNVVLSGANVVQTGNIVSDRGAVALVSGQNVMVGEKNSQVYAIITPDAGSKGMFAAGDVYSLAMQNKGKIFARQVTVQTDPTAKVSVSGTIDASNTNPGGVGGSINITGGAVQLSDASVNASGTAGAGTINIGGDQHGKGLLPDATLTTVSADTTIQANALSSGTGGTVVVWSNQQTNFSGSASAKGIGAGGNAEVSSQQQVNYSGTVTLTAASGKTGTLLIDPAQIVIDASATSPDPLTGPVLASSSSGTSTFTPAEILTLAGNGNLYLQATQSITINPNSPIAFAGSTTRTMVLDAPTITFGSAVTGHVNLVLANSQPGFALNVTGQASSDLNVTSTFTATTASLPNSVTVIANHLITDGFYALNNITLVGPNTASSLYNLYSSASPLVNANNTLMTTATFSTPATSMTVQSYTVDGALGTVDLDVSRFYSIAVGQPQVAAGTDILVAESENYNQTLGVSLFSVDPSNTALGIVPVTGKFSFPAATAIAANLNPVETQVSTSGVPLSASSRAILERLQIHVKPEEPPVQGNEFRYVNDLPYKLHPEPQDFKVSASRVSPEVAYSAAKLYDKLFPAKGANAVETTEQLLHGRNIGYGELASEINKLPMNDPRRQTMLNLKQLKVEIESMGLSKAEYDTSFDRWMPLLFNQEHVKAEWVKNLLEALH